MKCQNCGENNANVRYTEVINGKKKEYILCEKCAEELGVTEKMNYNMQIDLGNFFGGFFDNYNSNQNLLNSFNNIKELKCEKCGMTYNDFIKSGKFGCDNCYTVFSKRLDGVIKNLQGANIHTGRRGKKSNSKLKINNVENKQQSEEITKLKDLKEKLNAAIKEERYEDAAKFRDEIKKLEK